MKKKNKIKKHRTASLSARARLSLDFINFDYDAHTRKWPVCCFELCITKRKHFNAYHIIYRIRVCVRVNGAVPLAYIF